MSLEVGKYIIVSGNTFRDLEKAVVTSATEVSRIADNVIKDCAVVLDMPLHAISPKKLTYKSAFVGNQIITEVTGASSAVLITNAENMLVTGNIVSGTNAAVTVDASTTTGVIEENNITA